MKIRALKTRDIFPLSRILAKLDLGRLSRYAKDGDGEVAVVALVAVVAERLADLEGDLFPFLGDLAGITAEEFAELPFESLVDVIKQLAQRPEVAGFFASTKQDTP